MLETRLFLIATVKQNHIIFAPSSVNSLFCLPLITHLYSGNWTTVGDLWCHCDELSSIPPFQNLVALFVSKLWQNENVASVSMSLNSRLPKNVLYKFPMWRNGLWVIKKVSETFSAHFVTIMLLSLLLSDPFKNFKFKQFISLQLKAIYSRFAFHILY